MICLYVIHSICTFSQGFHLVDTLPPRYILFKSPITYHWLVKWSALQMVSTVTEVKPRSLSPPTMLIKEMTKIPSPRSVSLIRIEKNEMIQCFH